jgi:hypothetical protein
MSESETEFTSLTIWEGGGAFTGAASGLAGGLAVDYVRHLPTSHAEAQINHLFSKTIQLQTAEHILGPARSIEKKITEATINKRIHGLQTQVSHQEIAMPLPPAQITEGLTAFGGLYVGAYLGIVLVASVRYMAHKNRIKRSINFQREASAGIDEIPLKYNHEN